MIHRISLLSIAFFATTIVSAHDGLHGPAVTFDLDRDDKLTLEEYVAYMDGTSSMPEAEATERFGKLDIDSDGFVTNGELLRGVQS